MLLGGFDAAGNSCSCNPPLRGSARLHAVREADPSCVLSHMGTYRQEVHTTSHLSTFYPPTPPKPEKRREQKGGFLILGQEQKFLVPSGRGKVEGVCGRF